MTSINKILRISGVPNKKQKQFFASKAKFTAYGGSRGGGKSWALRRKLIAMCLRYPGIRCLIIRRSFGELKVNHVIPMQKEYGHLIEYRDSEKIISLPNGSTISLGFCSCNRDVLRYQGQEFDVIAIDEATQITEYQFSVFKACLRGVGLFPRRMYLTCNPGGVGHAWVKRLFIDRDFKEFENSVDYNFIPASVYDNSVLMKADPEYVRNLESLPSKMRDAWLFGKWDVFEGQFFPEFRESIHVCKRSEIPCGLTEFAAVDYGFDMLAALLLGCDSDGNVFVISEYCSPGLTLSQAAAKICELVRNGNPEYLVASPDLWNRRQDTGKSGFEIMQPLLSSIPMFAADNRRVQGWRVCREYLACCGGQPKLKICEDCHELIRSLPALIYDEVRQEDASDEPHDITHAPEALRYALMSRNVVFYAGNSDCPDFSFVSKKNTAVKNYFY